MSEKLEQTPSELDSTLAEVLLAAVNLHESGQLEEAESVYRSLLELVPDNAQANCFLGVLLVQRERVEEALGFLRAAVVFDATVPAHWYTYIEVLITANRIPMAEDALKLAREKGLPGVECDAFSIMTIMDNDIMMLQNELGFLSGDGALHWYLVNWCLEMERVKARDIGSILI